MEQVEQVERWSGGAGGTVGRWRPEFTRSSQGVHSEFTVPGQGTGRGLGKVRAGIGRRGTGRGMGARNGQGRGMGAWLYPRGSRLAEIGRGTGKVGGSDNIEGRRVVVHQNGL